MIVWLVLAAVLFLGLLFRHPHFLRDVRFVLNRLKTGSRIRKYIQTNHFPLDQFLEEAKAQPHKPLLLYEDETYTFRDADELSNKAARALLQTGQVKKGDTVALFLRNEPVFLWLWLGLMKIGCSAAFLNCNIRSKSLLHCFNCSRAKTLIAGQDLEDAVEEILPGLLEQQVSVFVLADRCRNAHVESFKDKMSCASSEPIPKDFRSHLTLLSPAVYIYTSGTTGLPKAAVITHARLWVMALFLTATGVNSEDVIYITLPLYHSAAMAGVTTAFVNGLTVALRSKFSASRFWDDCRKYNVTIIQYIGELMHYLCNTPKKLNDQSHKVRLAVGNGIRPDVWKDFINRFGNICIIEFYGATEGNFGLTNYSNKIGAVGRDTFLHRLFLPYSFLKFDVNEGKPLRDAAGFCIKAAKGVGYMVNTYRPKDGGITVVFFSEMASHWMFWMTACGMQYGIVRGEPGLLVCEITPTTPFLGYAGDLQQTEKKRLHDVYRKGDVYFNTGDLMSVDDNFIYFKDRVGDTFRWKGENVSTTEVSDIITLADCIEEANVYGVEVPGMVGRAGMAAVTLREGQTFDAAAVFEQVETFLPSYARPRFMRIQSSLDVTGTFKHVKTKLVKEGFDPNQITDPLYFLDEKEKNYVPLTLDIFNSITAGKIRI